MNLFMNIILGAMYGRSDTREEVSLTVSLDWKRETREGRVEASSGASFFVFFPLRQLCEASIILAVTIFLNHWFKCGEWAKNLCYYPQQE